MEGIAMCTNAVCPLKRKCVRYMSTPGLRQTWAHFEFTIVDGLADCDAFWEDKLSKDFDKDKGEER